METKRHDNGNFSKTRVSFTFANNDIMSLIQEKHFDNADFKKISKQTSAQKEKIRR